MRFVISIPLTNVAFLHPVVRRPLGFLCCDKREPRAQYTTVQRFATRLAHENRSIRNKRARPRRDLNKAYLHRSYGQERGYPLLEASSRGAVRGATWTTRRAVVANAQAGVGKRVLITGGNTGIGFETASALCSKGYEVVIACRDDSRANAAVSKLKSTQPSASISSVRLDLGNQTSIKDCANRLLDTGRPFDVLLNNAGVMATPKMTTTDGFEFQLGINHLGHFALTNLLLPSLVEANKSVRIINVASAAHQMGNVDFNDLFRDKPGAYQPWEAYGQSKLANILFTYELARRLQINPQITVNCLHPGVVRTELGRYMVNDDNKIFMGPAIALASLFFKTPEQGAQTSIYLASSPDVANVSAKYYDNCRPISSAATSYDVETAKKLWDVSMELTKVSPPAAVLARA